jgi:hypothetical protein
MDTDELLRKFIASHTEIRDLLQSMFVHTRFQTQMQQEEFYHDLLRLPRYADSLRLNRYEHKVFSQNGEDGIIAEIFNRIGTTRRTFVEIGVGNGLECNSTYLLWKGWKGLWIDGDASSLSAAQVEFRDAIAAGSLQISHEIVSGHNIAEISHRLGVPTEFDLLSIDIDRNTYFVWKGLSHLKPRAVVVEYNSTIPPSDEFCVSDDANAVWNGSFYFGASLKTLEKLGDELGYALVGCELVGANAFFVRKDLVADRFAAPFTSENHYEPPRYFLPRNSGHPPLFGEATVRRGIR